MKKILFFLLINFSVFAQNYQRDWGTYTFNERYKIYDSKVDSQGNLYVVGIVSVSPYSCFYYFENLTNPYNNQPLGGETDGIIIKYNNLGQIVWGTYIGGSGNDKVTSIDIDTNDNIYIIGVTNSTTNIASINAYQPQKEYGSDFMIAKFQSNGILDWNTYYGGNGNEDSYSIFGIDSNNVVITHDKTNNLYFAGITDSTNLSTPGSFQYLRDKSRGVLTKFSDSGSLIWSTYYTQNIDYITSLSTSDNALYVSGFFNDCDTSVDGITQNPPSTYYGTIDGFQPQSDVCHTQFLSKFNFSGQRIWGTYYENTLGSSIQNSVKTYQDKVYLAGNSYQGNMGTTGTFQPNGTPNKFTPYLVQFNEDGTRNWATYNGLTNEAQAATEASVNIDQDGNAYLYGSTTFPQNISTTNAYQTDINGTRDGYISKFDTNGQKLWGSYYGGENYEDLVGFLPYQDGFYLVGMTNSITNIATPISDTEIQPYEICDEDAQNPQNIFVAHFKINPLSTKNNTLNKLELYPNPNNGNFTFKGNFIGLQNLKITIYDNQGRIIYINKPNVIEDIITVNLENKVQTGMYFVKVSNTEIEQTIKMIIE